MASHPNATHVQKVKSIVREIITTRTDEMDCPACHDHLDRYAELILEGSGAHAAMPRLRDHLEHCPHCREEFEALLDALRAIQ
jgi:hypothetical protein